MATSDSTFGAALLSEFAHALQRDPKLGAEFARALAPYLPGAAPEYLTTKDVAARVRMHPKSVARAMNAGLLTGERIGNRWQTTPAAVDAWRDRGCPLATLTPAQATRRARRAKARTSRATQAILTGGRPS